jgi:hypothetical protein
MAESRSRFDYIPPSSFKELQEGIDELYELYSSYNRLGVIHFAQDFCGIVAATNKKDLFVPVLIGIIILELEEIIAEYKYTNPDPIYLWSWKVYGSDLFGEFNKLLHISANNPLHDYVRYIYLLHSYEFLVTYPNDHSDALLKKIEHYLRLILNRKKNNEEMFRLKNELPINFVLQEKMQATIKYYRGLSCQDRIHDVNFMDFINRTCDEYAPRYQLDAYQIRQELYFFIMADNEKNEWHLGKRGELYKRCQQDTGKQHSSYLSDKTCMQLAAYWNKLQDIHEDQKKKLSDYSLLELIKSLTKIDEIKRRLQLFIPKAAEQQPTTLVARATAYTTQTLFGIAANRLAQNPLVSQTGQRVVFTIATTAGLTIAGPGGALIAGGLATMVAPEIVSFICNKLMEPIGSYAGNLVLNVTDNGIKMMFGENKENIEISAMANFFKAILKSPNTVVSDEIKFALFKFLPLTPKEIKELSLLPEQMVSNDCIIELCRIYNLYEKMYLEDRQLMRKISLGKF